ncbi:MAG: hypothetical protein LBG52_04165 [Candidatus Peribacteria bacterium]|nr:hypothetical protein [Candidatus Peribacteria bacterium]
MLVSILSIGFLAPIIAILSLIDGIKFFLMSEVEFKKILDKKGTEREDIEEEENTEEEESLESELEKLYREYPLSLENMEMRKKLEAKIREDWKTKKVQQKKEKKERKDEGKEEEKGETQSG